jgi:hypothetical protein
VNPSVIALTRHKLKGANGGCTDRNDPPARFQRAIQLGRCLICDLIPLAMQNVFFDPFGMNWLERPQAHVQSYFCDLYTPFPNGMQDFGGEMQPGGRRRH